MSRLSLQNFAARNRNRKAEERARRDAAVAFKREQALLQQEAKNRERQQIIDANLQAQIAAGQMYAQNQYTKQADRSRMANDTTLRQRNRLDGIFDRKQQMAAAWEQSRIQQQLADQAAEIQAQRDAALHGYNQSDARLQHGFNQDMSRLTHGQQMRRDATQQRYGQQNAAQAQQYAVDNANLQQRFNTDNAHLQNQFATDRDARLQQYGQEDLRLQQEFAQNNWIDKVIEERSRAGYTLNPSQQRMADEIEEKKGNALKLYMSGELTQQDYTQQLRQLSQAKRHLIPDVPPEAQQLPSMDQYWQTHVKEDEFGNIIYRDPSTGKVTFDRARPTGGGSGSEKAGRYDKDTGKLNPAEASSVYADMRKAYQQHRQEASKPNADGTPSKQKVKTWEEFVRSEALQYPPDERAVFEEFMGGPKQSSIDKIKNNREMSSESGYSQIEAMPPSEAPDWQQKGADILNQNVARIQAIAELGQKQLMNLPNDPLVTGAMAINPEKAAPIIAELKRAMQKFEIIARTGSDPDVKDPGLLDYQKSLRNQLRQITGSRTNVNLPPSGASGIINTDAQWANPVVHKYEF